MAQSRVIMGSEVRIGSELWTLWSEGTRAGRYWAFQRGEKTRWLEVRYVTSADGHKVWQEAR
jgi:AAA+ ATPase superfamily predicted ATPase